MAIRAALLTDTASSGAGVYIRIDELEDEAQLTERHVPTITKCDLPGGRYIWQPDSRNAYGGAFVPKESVPGQGRSSSEVIEAVEKVLGEPVASEFSEKAWKIRTNLIIAAAIAVGLSLANLKIQKSSTIFGLQFDGLSDVVITNALTALVTYLLIHFLWVCWDGFFEWRLRITGTRTGYKPFQVFASEHVDVSSDARQSTLYNWWIQNADAVGDLRKLACRLEDKHRAWEERLDSIMKNGNPQMNLSEIARASAELGDALVALGASVKKTADIIDAPRLRSSLARFDRWFEIFLRSQNLRWFLIDALAPVAFAVWALYLLRQ